MVKTLSFPSVYEATLREFCTNNDPILGFSKIKLDSMDYMVGLQAMNEGVSPHKSINASPEDTDYKLISSSALVLASNMCQKNTRNGKLTKMHITTGFPFATYQMNRDNAAEFFQDEKIITYYKAEETGDMKTEQKVISIAKVHVLPEVMGCDIAIRKGENPIDGNYVIISLGYGTCEGAVSNPDGLMNRTLFSTHGMSYAINLFTQELNKNAYLRLKTEHQVDQIFTKGFIYIDRKKKDFAPEKRKALQLYYTNVISPIIKRYITDEDFEQCQKITLVGGGAYHADLINLFNQEFGDIASVTVCREPEKCASVGYAIYSKQNATNQEDEKESFSSYRSLDSEDADYIGIDIGNANTCVSVVA